MKKFIIILLIFLPIYPNAKQDVKPDFRPEVSLEFKLDKLNRDLKTLQQLIKLDETP